MTFKAKVKNATSIAAAIALLVVPVLSPIMMSQNASASAVEEIKRGTGQVSSASSGADLPSIAKTVVNTMLFIVGILAVIMIIFSGIRYITAHGDKGQVESAKNTLIYSIVGLVIAIIAYALVTWVTGLFS